MKKPILVARHLVEAPQTLLVGEGPSTLRARSDFLNITIWSMKRGKSPSTQCGGCSRAKNPISQGRVDFDIPGYWNFKRHWDEMQKQFCRNTIAVVSQDVDGHFAVCVSIGGSCPMMHCRVGDAALPRCGVFSGTKGAVAVTGIGEYNSRVVLAYTVYRWIESGMPLQQALDLGVAALPEDIDTGIIGVTTTEAATSANRPMSTHIIRE